MKLLIYNVFMVFAIATFTKGAVPMKPMGIKMCERQCQCLKGCYAIQYDTVSLQCTTLTDPKDEVKGRHSVITKTVSSTKGTSQGSSLSCQPETCSEGERSFMNRHHQPVCVPLKASVDATRSSSPWLLMIPRFTKEKNPTAFKMNLITKEVQSWPFFWRDTLILDFLPVPSKGIYIIACLKNVLSSPMSRRQDSIIWRDITAYFMRLDSKQELVFLYFQNFTNSVIGKMNTDGQRKQDLHLLSRNRPVIWAMDIDPQQEKIYFITNTEVLRISYNGNEKELVMEISDRKTMEVLVYDPSRSVLYMMMFDSDSMNLMYVSTSTTSPVSVVHIHFKEIASVLLHSGIFYLYIGRINQIISVNVSMNKPTATSHPLPSHSSLSRLLLSIM